MAIGERIHFFRTMRGMTQKYLGMALGFPEKSADVRLAQYENGSRTPKADVTAALAQALDVSPKALDVPDIDSYVGLMHTLFTLEDRYGLHTDEADGEICLKVDVRKSKDSARLHEMLCSWQQAAAMLEAGEISKEDYDKLSDTAKKYVAMEKNIKKLKKERDTAVQELGAVMQKFEAVSSELSEYKKKEENAHYFSREKQKAEAQRIKREDQLSRDLQKARAFISACGLAEDFARYKFNKTRNAELE